MSASSAGFCSRRFGAVAGLPFDPERSVLVPLKVLREFGRRIFGEVPALPALAIDPQIEHRALQHDAVDADVAAQERP